VSIFFTAGIARIHAHMEGKRMVRIRNLRFAQFVFQPVVNLRKRPAAAVFQVVNFDGKTVCAARSSGAVVFFSPEELFTTSSAALEAAKAMVST